MKKQDIPIAEALHRLCPNASWHFRDEDIYENLVWQDKNYAKPTKQQLENLVAVIVAEREAVAYKTQRAKEYPPITDYLDGIVKGDQQQIAAYITACQAVKAKYPKPE